jgi:hypothetical protein
MSVIICCDDDVIAHIIAGFLEFLHRLVKIMLVIQAFVIRVYHILDVTSVS